MRYPVDELLDKRSIIQLKIERIPTRKKELEQEYKDYTEAILEYEIENIASSVELAEWHDELYKINGQIWDLEADIRSGKEGELGLEEIGKRELKGLKFEIDDKAKRKAFLKEAKKIHQSEYQEELGEQPFPETLKQLDLPTHKKIIKIKKLNQKKFDELTGGGYDAFSTDDNERNEYRNTILIRNNLKPITEKMSLEHEKGHFKFRENKPQINDEVIEELKNSKHYKISEDSKYKPEKIHEEMIVEMMADMKVHDTEEKIKEEYPESYKVIKQLDQENEIDFDLEDEDDITLDLPDEEDEDESS